MKNLKLYEGFIKKRLDDTILYSYNGVIKLYFKEYYIFIYTFMKNNKREVYYCSILDKLIFVNEILYIKNRCYIDVDKNKFILNDLELDFDTLPDINFDIDEKTKLNIYFNRSLKETIDLYKYIDNKWNLEGIFKNKETLTKEQREELAYFVSKYIRDVSYLTNAENFDLI